MADIMDIDEILEDDLIDALGNMGELANVEIKIPEITNVPLAVEEKIVDNVSEDVTEQTVSNNISSSVSIDSSNIDSIALLLKELLNNKTIEITIKIK